MTLSVLDRGRVKRGGTNLTAAALLPMGLMGRGRIPGKRLGLIIQAPFRITPWGTADEKWRKRTLMWGHVSVTPLTHTNTHICMAAHSEYHPTQTPQRVRTCDSAVITDGMKMNASHKQTYEKDQQERKILIHSKATPPYLITLTQTPLACAIKWLPSSALHITGAQFQQGGGGKDEFSFPPRF